MLKAFSAFTEIIMVFVFVSVYRFAYDEPTLHPQDEAYLIMMDKLCDVLLHSVFQYFIEDFCIYVHHGYWPEVFFFSCVSARFWYQDYTGQSCKMSYGGFPLFVLYGIVSEGMVPAPLCVSGRIRL